jgi:hypothetical protein
MTVRAKMTCESIEKTDAETRAVRLRPVTSDSPENASWSKYTPWGDVTLGITNPAAYDAFEVGKTYWVDFTPIDAA